MKFQIAISAVVFAVFAAAFFAGTSVQASDPAITRSDVDRIVRALEAQTRAIQEAGRACRK